jgi:hypothetical protein
MEQLKEFKILAVEIFGERIELKTPLVIKKGEQLYINDEGNGLTILRVDLSTLEPTIVG